MDDRYKKLSSAQLLRLLEVEAGCLAAMKKRMAEELHHLQVEEKVYTAVVGKLQKERQEQRDELDREILEAMGMELADEQQEPGSVQGTAEVGEELSNRGEDNLEANAGSPVALNGTLDDEDEHEPDPSEGVKDDSAP